MAQYRLHCFCQSGNSYKVALYLNCAGLDWEPVFVNFFNGATRDPSWRASVNEMGEAPVLETGAKTFTQSGAILLYLAEMTDKFAPETDDERNEALRWILFDNHKFTSFNATHRFLNTFKGASDPDPAVMAFLRARVDGSFAVVDKYMQGRAFVADDQPTIADFSMMGYLFFPPDELGFDIAQAWPAIAAWKQRMQALPGWVGPYELLPSADMPRR
jgi:glutathione S-transferase